MATTRHDQGSFEKLDPGLAALTRLPDAQVADVLSRDEQQRRRSAGGLSPAAMFGVRKGKDGRMWASVLIRFRGDAARLAEKGAQIAGVIGDVATADVPLDALRAIEADDGVVFVEIAHPLSPLLDLSVRDIGAAALHAGDPALRGRGVVIGIVDIGGFDIHHPDFSVAGSTPARTRIERYWDQTAPWPPRADAGGRRPDGWAYGIEYTADEVDRDAAGEVAYRVVDAPPRHGHGTHVTGIAAGNGRASGGRYTGVAPDASLVLVNLRSTDGEVGTTSTLCDALDYIFARANGRPCVVNVSLGTRRGPRNGTSNAERAIDRLVATPGRAVVIAAGNDGGTRKYTRGSLPAERATLAFGVPRELEDAEGLELWYPGGERLGVTVITPDGEEIGPVPAGGRASETAGRTTITVSSTLADARNGDNCIQVLLHPEEYADVPPGTWQLVLTREGAPAAAAESAYHAVLFGDGRTEWKEPTDRSTLTSPGTAEGAITVANYLHRAGGGISTTSSRGPTPDGRRKPDLAAPGSGVCSTICSPSPADRGPIRGEEEDLASFYGELPPEPAPARARAGRPGTRAAQGQYQGLTGTSMAAPHVAGLVALIYEREGPIAIERVKELLVAHADRTSLGEGWSPASGWGRARAPAK